METLLNKGLDVNSKTSDGSTLLEIELNKKKSDISEGRLEFLFSKGADVNKCKNKDGLLN
jgi:ankyrin repeat protein